jgi:hypothetical protein
VQVFRDVEIEATVATYGRLAEGDKEEEEEDSSIKFLSNSLFLWSETSVLVKMETNFALILGSLSARFFSWAKSADDLLPLLPLLLAELRVVLGVPLVGGNNSGPVGGDCCG